MKIRSRRVMNLAGRLGAGAVQAILATATVRELVEDPDWHPLMAGASRSFLLALWHENLLVAGWAVGRYPNTYTLASGSEDGEIAAGVASAFGLEVWRGSSSQGGVRALKQIVDFARSPRRFRLALTLDGPRGPRRVAKEGLAYVASRCDLPIVCVGVACRDAWRLRSWDRMQIPRPFRRVQIHFTAPIAPGAKLSRAGLEEYSRFIESEMSRAQYQAECALERPCVERVRSALVAS
jgi:lysophospholipid acyltransferase (LPLAT)-like uncharacterized protein